MSFTAYTCNVNRKRTGTNSLRKVVVAFLIVMLAITHPLLSAQKTYIIKFSNLTIEEAMKRIRQETGFTFTYVLNSVQGKKKVTMDLKTSNIAEVLDQCFQNTELSYSIEGNNVIVRENNKKPASVTLLLQQNASQTATLVGYVYDETGAPISGANVAIKNSKIATVTSIEGKFEFRNIPSGSICVVSYVGYVPQETVLNTEKTVYINLQQSKSTLDEVQVIAYGTSSKRFNVGNVSTVTSEELAKQPVQNFLAAIQGRVPGMQITQNTGAPGGGFSVTIRGRTSVNGSINNEPLYVIDGVPYSNDVLLRGSSIIGTGSMLNYINMSDIESVSVLKDADATAIYGSRAANGVVLITTKKGKVDQFAVSLDVNSGFSKQTKTLQLLNTGDYRRMRKEAFQNDNLSSYPATAYDINGVWDSTRNTDWIKTLAGKSASLKNAQLSVSGGNSNVQYLISSSYYYGSSIYTKDFNDKKGTVHFNLTSYSNNRKFTNSITFTTVYDVNKLFFQDIMQSTFQAPNAPALFDSTGKLNWAPLTPGVRGTWVNPYQNFLRQYQANVYNTILNYSMSYEVVKDLAIKVSAGTTNMWINERNAIPNTYYDPGRNLDSRSATFVNTKNSTFILEPQVTFKKKFGGFSTSYLLGGTYNNQTNDGTRIAASGYPSDLLLKTPSGASIITSESVGNTVYKFASGFFRATFDYNKTYFLNLAARRDGSSRFGPDKRYANFASVGAGYIFTENAFIKEHMKFLSFGKIRTSYGTSGNDKIGDYSYLNLFSATSTSLPFQGTQGLYPISINIPDYSWEVNKKWEGGLELGFLADRISVGADYFINTSTNQLINYSLPGITGFTSIIRNSPAKVRNEGFEMSLTSQNIKTKSFSWNTSFNLSVLKNKLVSYPGFESSTVANQFVLGKSLNINKVYHSVGVNPTSGIYEYTDAKGNITATPSFANDRTAIVDLNPKYFGGMENTFSYKGVELSVFLQFVNRTNYIYWFGFDNPAGTGIYNIPQYVYDNRWTAANPNAKFQRLTSGSSSAAINAYGLARSSDLAFTSGSFVRLKNISLSYSVPGNVARKLFLKDLRVYANAQNLAVFSKYPGPDPETISPYTTAPLRTIVFGLQVKL